MKHLVFLAGLAWTGFTPAAFAQGVAEHTLLIVWAAKNCEGFDYAPDLLRHATIEVQSAPRAEIEALAAKVIGGLDAIHEGNKAEMCDTAIFLIENPEED